jgi:hypothetical protein
MAGMKIEHGCQPPPEASRRHGYIHAVPKVFLNFFCGQASSVIHGIILSKKLNAIFDANQRWVTCAVIK